MGVDTIILHVALHDAKDAIVALVMLKYIP